MFVIDNSNELSVKGRLYESTKLILLDV